MRGRSEAGIQWISPLPPLRTGIAAYCQDFLSAVDGIWPLGLILEDGSADPEFQSIRRQNPRAFDPVLPTILHLGNSEHHERAFEASLRASGVVVLHDVVLHHAILARSVRRNREREYWRELRERYGRRGVRAGRDLMAGRTVEELEDYPLSERFLEKARIVVVHSRYAQEQARSRVPNAEVRRAPMGVPVPDPIPVETARARLGISKDRFVIASVTHVNPNKRLHVVLRAIRRLVNRVPETRFVIAGEGSDGQELQREVRMLGLQRHVTCLGYVDDATARHVAAASDVCVNLRYPSTGETSASLLRLLAAGRATLVTDYGPASDVPNDVVFKIAPDALEVDIIEEVLAELASRPALRSEAGSAAREWMIKEHSMGAAVDGYRAAVEEAFGIRLPPLNDPVVREASHVQDWSSPSDLRASHSRASMIAADAIAELGISQASPVVRAAAEAIVDFKLQEARSPLERASREPSQRLLGRVRCPDCDGKIDVQDGGARCSTCGRCFNRNEGYLRFDN